MTTDQLERALRRAFALGEVHWRQSDSESFSENRKVDETRAKFNALIAETIALATSANLKEPQSP
jgi:hypothetical protein